MAKTNTNLSCTLIDAGARVAQAVSAKVLMVFIDAVSDLAHLREAIKEPTKVVLIARQQEDEVRAAQIDATILTVPRFNLSRMDQIKMSTLIALSHGVLKGQDVFVFLTGAAGQHIDTLVSMEVGTEYELFQSVNQPKLTEHIRRVVFEKALTLILELANEGREGKPIGTLMVIGDHREVVQHCTEGRINPFKGYTEKDRNILDDSIHDTIKELAKLDGAFIVKGNGVILSAGTTVLPAVAALDLPQGLGARHAAAAAITACTKSVALSVSESTGSVRVWRRGQMITEIEKALKIPPTPSAIPSKGN